MNFYRIVNRLILWSFVIISLRNKHYYDAKELLERIKPSLERRYSSLEAYQSSMMKVEDHIQARCSAAEMDIRKEFEYGPEIIQSITCFRCGNTWRLPNMYIFHDCAYQKRGTGSATV